MKRILIVLLSLSLLTACNNNPLVKKDKMENDDRNKDDDDDNGKKKSKYDDDEDDDNKKGKYDKDDEDDDEDDDRGGGAGWTSANRKSFVSDCVGEAKKNMSTSQASSYCDCMQQKIEKKYDLSFSEANKLTEADFSTPQVQADIKECLE